MMIRLINYLLFVFFFFSSCKGQINERQDKLAGNFFGTRISDGTSTRRGGIYTDSAGTKYFYCYTSSKIINDSTVPSQVNIAFSNEYYHPEPAHDQKFRVFLLPESMTNHGMYNKEVKKCMDDPITINKTLQPKEECIVSIGFLIETRSDTNFLNPIPFRLLLKGDKSNYVPSIPDSAINNLVSVNNQIPLVLGLGNWRKQGYCVIPCGYLSFAD